MFIFTSSYELPVSHDLYLFCKSEGGQCRTKYQGHVGAVNTVALHPSEDLAISGSGDTEVHLWPYNLENMNTSDQEDQELVINQPILRIGNHDSIVSR